MSNSSNSVRRTTVIIASSMICLSLAALPGCSGETGEEADVSMNEQQPTESRADAASADTGADSASASASRSAEAEAEADADADAATEPKTPSPAIQAWMDRLTVAHEFDPQTGFIVAKETITLPDVLANAPALDAAVEQAATDGRIVIAFATADRCAPCQQYKKDALTDERVVERLKSDAWIATHIEVDAEPDMADQYLGSRGIPMTYALRNGEQIAVLRGQRSADDLLAWLDALPGG
ncbi:MAG: thioredoxin family protein [Planctomycetota bacterium]